MEELYEVAAGFYHTDFSNCAAFVTSAINGLWKNVTPILLPSVPPPLPIDQPNQVEGVYSFVTSIKASSLGNAVAGGMYYTSVEPYNNLGGINYNNGYGYGGVYCSYGGFIVEQVNGRWKPSVSIQSIQPNLTDSSYATVLSVSASSDDYAIAGGQASFSGFIISNPDVFFFMTPVLLTKKQGIWTSDSPNMDGSIYSVSSSSDGNGIAVGFSTIYGDPPINIPMVINQIHGQWQTPQTITVPSFVVGENYQSGILMSCSASTDTNAIAGGFYVIDGSFLNLFAPLSLQAMVTQKQSNGSWSDAIPIVLPSDASANLFSIITNVTSSSENNGIAVGFYLNNLNQISPMVSEQINGTWKPAFHIALPSQYNNYLIVPPVDYNIYSFSIFYFLFIGFFNIYLEGTFTRQLPFLLKNIKSVVQVSASSDKDCVVSLSYWDNQNVVRQGIVQKTNGTWNKTIQPIYSNSQTANLFQEVKLTHGGKGLIAGNTNNYAGNTMTVYEVDKGNLVANTFQSTGNGVYSSITACDAIQVSIK